MANSWHSYEYSHSDGENHNVLTDIVMALLTRAHVMFVSSFLHGMISGKLVA